MGLITVQGIRVFAHHGHLPEEAVLGGHFIVNVWVEADTTEVEKEMKQEAKEANAKA